VASVESGSCGETAGLKQGDIITALGDTKIESYTDLAAALKNYAAGDSTTITVYRNGEETTLNITFDERKPSDDTDATTESTESTQQTDPGFGGFGNIFP
jgi:serine protease Do